MKKGYRLPDKWNPEDDAILKDNWQKKDPIWIAEKVLEARFRRAHEKHAAGGKVTHCHCGDIAVGSCRAGTVILRAAFLGLVPMENADVLANHWYREHRKLQETRNENRAKVVTNLKLLEKLIKAGNPK